MARQSRYTFSHRLSDKLNNFCSQSPPEPNFMVYLISPRCNWPITLFDVIALRQNTVAGED